MMDDPQTPDICRWVHYRTHGSPDGTHPSECVPALVTQRARADRPLTVGMTVHDPIGLHVHPIQAIAATRPDGTAYVSHTGGIDHSGHSGHGAKGTWHWPLQCPYSHDVASGL